MLQRIKEKMEASHEQHPFLQVLRQADHLSTLVQRLHHRARLSVIVAPAQLGREKIRPPCFLWTSDVVYGRSRRRVP